MRRHRYGTTMTWSQRWLRAESAARPRLLVVGGASLDVIHVRGEHVATPGGAGLYTALAAVRAGAEVTMLAPLPDPMPPELAPALDLLTWVGPRVPLSGLPRFEIAYDDDGAVSFFREHLGAEPDMTPALLDGIDDIPGCAYCVPFLDARLQQDFVRSLAGRGCLTVAGTYGKAARQEADVVRQTAALADLFFCNADEATLLFGSVETSVPHHGQLRFITRGSRGATVFQGDHLTEVAGVVVDPLDPTGAGDTFCGTTLARLLTGDHPVEATRRGNAAAAEMVTMVGPTALWRPGPPPTPPTDPRARFDTTSVEKLGALIRGLHDLRAFDFVGDLFPPVGDPTALDWFFAATLQQFGFWTERDGRYASPMIATIDGNTLKGSDYLWAQYLRWGNTEPGVMAPPGQAAITEGTWRAAAIDDRGTDPYPDPGTRVALANAYGRSLAGVGADPIHLVEAAVATARPMRALLRLLDHVGGYREDPLRKKAALLGIILRQRPEAWLPARAGDDAPPIVDYHVQRTALRSGIVSLDDPDLSRRIANREVLTVSDEAAVRRATFEAVIGLAEVSGREMGTVDWFLFRMRHLCPEMSAPVCAECPARPACAQRIELFQPVLRTTAY